MYDSRPKEVMVSLVKLIEKSLVLYSADGKAFFIIKK